MQTSPLTRWMRIATVAAAAVALLALPAAWLLSGQSQRVQYISAFDEATVEVNRFTFEDDEDRSDEAIVAIYGAPSGEPESVLFVDDERLIRPDENPALVLLPKAADENPLQVQTVWFFARATALGAGLAALGGLLLLFVLAKRARRGTAVATA